MSVCVRRSAIPLGTEQSSLMLFSLMPKVRAEEVRRFREHPRPDMATDTVYVGTCWLAASACLAHVRQVPCDPLSQKTRPSFGTFEAYPPRNEGEVMGGAARRRP